MLSQINLSPEAALGTLDGGEWRVPVVPVCRREAGVVGTPHTMSQLIYVFVLERRSLYYMFNFVSITEEKVNKYM